MKTLLASFVLVALIPAAALANETLVACHFDLSTSRTKGVVTLLKTEKNDYEADLDSAGHVDHTSDVVQKPLHQVTANDNLDLIFAGIEKVRPTGIVVKDIKYFQSYQLSGNDDFNISLLELFNDQKVSLGWIFGVMGDASGCYPN